MKIYFLLVLLSTVIAFFFIWQLDKMNADFKIMLYSVLAYIFLDPICKLIIAAIKGIVSAIITICGK